MGFESVIGFIDHLQNVTTHNYASVTELHTPAQTKKLSRSSLPVASNGGLSPSSGFLNRPRPHLLASDFSQLQFLIDSTTAESELLYDWRFTASQFILAPSPLRVTTRDFLLQLNPCSHSPYATYSLTRE
jgi:hypothetical protein